MRKLYEIAADIRKNWVKVSPYAAPYLEALGTLSSAEDHYICDDAQSVAAYFLSNAHSFKGPAAKALKAELKAAVGIK
jgi:hypothetical protein